MHKRSILQVGNKRRLGSTFCVLSANRWIAIKVINACVYLCICQSFNVSQHNLWNYCILPTLPFLAERFRVVRSLSDFLFVNEVFSFLFRSSFYGFCCTVRETGDPIDTTQQVAEMLQTQTQHCPHRCFLRTGTADHQQSSATLVLPSSSRWQWQ